MNFALCKHLGISKDKTTCSFIINLMFVVWTGHSLMMYCCTNSLFCSYIDCCMSYFQMNLSLLENSSYIIVYLNTFEIKLYL